jgi:hypothetical protein
MGARLRPEDARARLAERLVADAGALLPGAPAATAALLGWDAPTLAAFCEAPRLLVTMPHASPNVFFPRAAVAWYARHLQVRDAELFHVRLMLTHNNFGDLGWRPYAYWYLNDAGALARATLFTRNKKLKHVIVASRPPLGEPPVDAGELDREAYRHAQRAANLALSCMLMMAFHERRAGVARAARTLYLPLDWLVASVRAQRAAGTPPGARLAALMDAAPARRLGEGGELAPAADWRDAYVFDNPTNVALAGALGDVDVIGGAKMHAYWPDVAAAAARASLLVRFRQWPGLDASALPVKPSATLQRALLADGIEYSQGMALAEHGAYAVAHDPFAP